MGLFDYSGHLPECLPQPLPLVNAFLAWGGFRDTRKFMKLHKEVSAHVITVLPRNPKRKRSPFCRQGLTEPSGSIRYFKLEIPMISKCLVTDFR